MGVVAKGKVTEKRSSVWQYRELSGRSYGHGLGRQINSFRS